MATVAAVIASTHHPFYYRASTAPQDQRPLFAAEWIAKITAFRETLTRARPDVLVMVGSDHFHQLWLDNMPQFLVGHAEQYDANWYNEEREFGLPRMLLPGQRDLSWHILRQGLEDNGCGHAEQGANALGEFKDRYFMRISDVGWFMFVGHHQAVDSVN